uniref:Uncharacterized protein n=1 Tax=Arundo donax TaxID=35708 RepID=A0A0A8Y559_ARUDO
MLDKHWRITVTKNKNFPDLICKELAIT